MKNVMYLIVAMVTIFGIWACSKEANLEEHLNASKTSTKESSSGFRLNHNDLQSIVSYNAQHDVLVFNSLDDVYRLQEYLSNQNPYDRGNTTQIITELEKVLTHGFASGSQSSNNGVNLQNLQLLLENSHPLSDVVLEKMLDVHRQVNFPNTFVTTILRTNVPFSYDVREKVTGMTNLSMADKTGILEADDDLLDRMDYVYEDFLKLFPTYKSTYEYMVNKNIQDLNAGMSVTDRRFDDCVLKTDFERLIRNEKYEVYIDGHLLKAYTDCKEIMFKASMNVAYNDLQAVDGNGNVTIPTLSETAQGISMTTINQSIPTAYAAYNPQEFDPIGTDPSTDINYNTALQTINIIETCPKSNYIANLYTLANDKSVQFDNTTNFTNVPDPTAVHQYWDFGDGTGSFLTNPVHTYSAYGTYNVILTSFSTDCGCWHRHKTEITIQEPRMRGGNLDCEIFPSIVDYNTNDYIFTIYANPDVTPALPGNEVFSYVYKVYKTTNGGVSYNLVATINSVNDNIDYDAGGIGKYYVQVEATWDDGCFSVFYTEDITLTDVATPVSGCCDKKAKEKDKELPYTVGSNYYEFKYKDIIRGRVLKRVGGQQSLYKRNAKGKMKKVKANHDVDVGSNHCPKLISGECQLAWNNYQDLTNTGTERRFEYGNYWPSEDNFAFKGTCDFTHFCSYGPDLVVNGYVQTLVCEE
ncbi:PKD domain-containing protein [Aureispira anguillae]|uniref:PKD domain-containing protein n=1 Tax=Aureispira anguillae TaxID=2864201 RepID=A0A915YHE5_9BACT|nr:PKD domain-containing protein [Aureispira anguillae]BDS13118.1 PKD domain-containing protein [Aureispira anguillae]